MQSLQLFHRRLLRTLHQFHTVVTTVTSPNVDDNQYFSCKRTVISCSRYCSTLNQYTQIRQYNNNLSMKSQIYLTRSDIPDIGYDVLKDECDITTWNGNYPVPRDELLRNICGKDAIFCMLTDKIDAEVLDQAGPNLKVIGTMSVGFDHIDIPECKKRGIKIGYTPDILTDATAELTIALLLCTSRRLLQANKEVYNGGWKSWAPTWMLGRGLKYSKVGIVGFGRIGQEVAKRIVPFNPTEILISNRSDKSELATSIGARQVSFEDLILNSDFIILCCALTPETTNLINYATFNAMKPNAILINTARGGIVDQDALYDALKSKRICAAGLDVTTPEPLPTNSPLLTLSNCVVLPHIASADVDTRNEMARITACNILAGLKGVKMHSELKI